MLSRTAERHCAGLAHRVCLSDRKRRRLGISHRIAAIIVATEERQISGRFRALLCGRFKATAMFGPGLRLQPSDAPGDRLYRHHQTLPEWSRGARDGGMEARQPIPRPTALTATILVVAALHWAQVLVVGVGLSSGLMIARRLTACSWPRARATRRRQIRPADRHVRA